MKPIAQEPTKHLRCPKCRRVWVARRGHPANRGKVIKTFNWPEAVCPSCAQAAGAVGLQAAADLAGPAGGGAPAKKKGE